MQVTQLLCFISMLLESQKFQVNIDFGSNTYACVILTFLPIMKLKKFLYCWSRSWKIHKILLTFSLDLRIISVANYFNNFQVSTLSLSLRTSSPEWGGDDVTLGGSENSGSVRVSGWESETASLELSSLIRSLPRPPWSTTNRRKPWRIMQVTHPSLIRI